MPHPDPDSPRIRPALAGVCLAGVCLCGVCLAMVLAAEPAASDEPAFADTPFDMAALDIRSSDMASFDLPSWPGDAGAPAPLPALRWALGPEGLALHLRAGADGHGPASVGLAFHVGGGVSLGAAGALDPGSGEVAGVISLEIGL